MQGNAVATGSVSKRIHASPPWTPPNDAIQNKQGMQVLARTSETGTPVHHRWACQMARPLANGMVLLQITRVLKFHPRHKPKIVQRKVSRKYLQTCTHNSNIHDSVIQKQHSARQQVTGYPQCCRVRGMLFKLKGKEDPSFATRMDLKDRMLSTKAGTIPFH